MTPMPRYWMSRLMLSCWTGSTGLVIATRPDSITAHLLGFGSSVIGTLCVILLIVFALFGVADFFINDLLPDRYRLAIIEHRHWGFVGMVAVLLLISSAIAMRDGVTFLLLPYLLPAAFAAVISFIDIFARDRKTATA